MRRQAVSCLSCLAVTVAAFASNCVPATQALSAPYRPTASAETRLSVAIAGSSTDIVRMPTPLSPAAPPAVVPVSPQRPVPDPPPPAPVVPAPLPPAAKIEPPPPPQLGRRISMTARIGSLSTDPGKGWLGVTTDPLELPVALAIGLRDASGALVLETTAGGPAARAGIRFGDVVLSYNGRAVDSMNELRQRVAAAIPGTDVTLEVWRVTTEDGDFLRTLRRLAEGGNATVMHRLGRMYAGGIGVARDDTEALGWFRKGAAAGNINSTAMVAIALIEGRGAGKDPQEGVYLLRAAAEKDNHEAMYRLGVLLVQGKVVEKDLAEAVRLLSRAAAAEHVPSMVDLGVMHQQGLGLTVNFSEAARWYKRGADAGNSLGMMYLGVLYEQGKGVERSEATAARLYRQAAELGHFFGHHNYAAMLDRGRGVERNSEQAADHVLKALALGNPFTYQQITKGAQGWSVEFRRALQRKLRDAGVFEGRIDGTIKGASLKAVEAYVAQNRRQEGRPQSGQPW